MPCTLVSQIDQPIQHGLCDFFFVVRTVFWLHFSSGLLGIEREVGDIRFFCCCLKLFALINCVFFTRGMQPCWYFSPNANCTCYLFQSHETLFRILNVGMTPGTAPSLTIASAAPRTAAATRPTPNGADALWFPEVGWFWFAACCQ